MNVGARTPNVLGPPAWLKEFAGRDWILPTPAKLNPAEFVDAGAVRVQVNSPGGVTAGTNEVQLVTLTAATGGTFTLSFGGQTTAAIAFDATAADVEEALEALSTIGDGNVSVTGSAGGPYTVTFQNALGNQNVAQMTASNASLTGAGHAIAVTTSTPGAVGAVAVPVDALARRVPAGTTLRFGAGKFAYVSTAAEAGATSVTIEALTTALADDDAAFYSDTGQKYIPSGSIVGRTLTERNANTPFGLATDSDDEIYFIPFDVVNANVENDCELLRHGATVAENHLPQATRDLLTANAALMTKVRAAYVMIIAAD
jgi:hypothetical protein